MPKSRLEFSLPLRAWVFFFFCFVWFDTPSRHLVSLFINLPSLLSTLTTKKLNPGSPSTCKKNKRKGVQRTQRFGTESGHIFRVVSIAQLFFYQWTAVRLLFLRHFLKYFIKMNVTGYVCLSTSLSEVLVYTQISLTWVLPFIWRNHIPNLPPPLFSRRIFRAWRWHLAFSWPEKLENLFFRTRKTSFTFWVTGQKDKDSR